MLPFYLLGQDGKENKKLEFEVQHYSKVNLKLDECAFVFGGVENFSGTFILQTSDGGTLVGGNYPFDNSSTDYDGALVKLDANNLFEWGTFTFPESPYNNANKDLLYDAVEVSDGYVLIGVSNQGTSNDSLNQLWAKKYDFTGNFQWEYIFPDNSVTGFECSYGLSATSTYGGDILIGGYVMSKSSLVTRAQLWVLSEDGTLINRIAGTKDNDKVEKVFTSSDGNYFAIGNTWDEDSFYSCSINNTFTTFVEKNIKVWKLNTSISQIWNKEIDFETGDYFTDAAQTDNGFAVLGSGGCEGEVYTLGNFDNQGNQIWRKKIIENDFSFPDLPKEIPFGVSTSCNNDIVVAINTTLTSGDELVLESHNSSSFSEQKISINLGSNYSAFSKSLTNGFMCLGTEIGINTDFSGGNLCIFDNQNCNNTCSDCQDCYFYLPDYSDPNVCRFRNSYCDTPLAEKGNSEGSNLIYEWSVFGGGTASFIEGTTLTSENPVIRFGSNRTYTVCFKAYFAETGTPVYECCQSVIIGDNNCNQPPVAHFSEFVDPASGVFTLNAVSSVGEENVRWDFGDANNSVNILTGGTTSPTISCDFNDRCVDVCLYVGNGCGSSSYCVELCDPSNSSCDPEPQYQPDNPIFPIVSDKTVSFNGFPTVNLGSHVYSWNFGDGSISSELNPTHTYDEYGNYTVCLTITQGCHKVCYCWTIVIVPGNGGNNLVIDIGEVCGGQGQTVSIPVFVNGFSQVTSLDLELELSNSAIGQITGIRSSSVLDNLGGSVLSSNRAKVNWFSGPAVDLNDNTIIFYIDIRLTGAVGLQSDIIITSSAAEVGANPTEITPSSTNGSVCVENSEIRICGQVVRPDGTGVQNVQVSLSGNSSQTTTTDSNGNYCFEGLQSGGNYEITPSKDDNHKNGLTGGDLSRIQRHILGIRNDLDTPYKLIAADVNLSKSLSGGDLSRIQRVILELDPRFLIVDSWKFVSKSYQFPNPLNPQTPDYPEKIELTNISNDQTSIDFIAMKMGDVNDSNNGQRPENQLDSKLATIKFNFEDKNVTQGEEFVSNVSVEGWTNITSANTSFQWDNTKFEYVDLVDLNTGLSLDPSLNFQKNKVSEGELGFLWFQGAGRTLSSNSVLFGVKFKAIGSPGSSSEFKLGNSPINQEFEDLDDLLDVSETVGVLAIQGQQNTLSVSPTNLNVGSDAGQVSFDVNSNTNWTVTKTASWFWISPDNGSGNGNVQVNYQENTSTSSRSATITVSANGVSDRVVTITQSGATPAATLAANPMNLTFDANGGNQTITVSSNLSWTASDNVGWLSIAPSSGSNNGTITVTAQNNTSTNNRSGFITLRGNGVSDVRVSVNQTGATPVPFMTVSRTNLNFDAGGGNATVNISSNVSWSATDDVSWLSLAPSTGSNNGSLNITCQQNSSASSRTARITVSGGGVSSRVINVAQEAAQTTNLTVNPSTVNVSSEAGQASFSISSNTNWTVNKTTPWFWLNPGSGSGNGTVSINYEENTSAQERTGTITVSANGVNRTVTVKQAGKTSNSFLTVNPTEINISSGSGAYNINVSSNVNWTVSESASWVNLSKNSGSNNDMFTINIETNPTNQERVALIRVSGQAVSAQVVTVTQEANMLFLDISPTVNSVSAQGGVFQVQVNSNTDWSISSNEQWVTASQNFGSNNGTINIDYERNETVNQRSAVVRFTASGVGSKTLVINQAGGTAPLNNTCNDRNNISSLFGKTAGVPQVSRIYDNTYANSQSSDPNYGYDCFDDGELNKTLWFRFVGDGSRYQIRTVRCDADNYITGGDTEMAIYKGNTCIDPEPAYCNEDFDFTNDLYFSNIEIPTENGQHYIMMIDGCNCWSDPDDNQFISFGEFCIEVTKLGSSSTETISDNDRIHFYPNPTSSEIFVDFNFENQQVSQITLIDAVGKIVQVQEVEDLRSGKLLLDVKSHPNGIYHLIVKSDKGVFTDRLIIQR